MLDPRTNYLNCVPFRTEGEYLEYLFVLLDLLLFPDPRQRLEKRGLNSEESSPLTADEWIPLFRDRLEMTKASGPEPVAEQLLAKLNAPFYMRYLLAFLIRCALDSAYEVQAAAGFGKSGLTLYDLCALFADPETKEDPSEIYEMLENGRNTMQFLFPQLLARERRTGQSLAGMLPIMDARLLAVLLGKKDIAPLAAGMEVYIPKPEIPAAGTGSAENIADEKKDIARETTGEQRAAETLLRRQKNMPAEIVVLWGPEGSGKRDAVQALADRTGRGLIFYEIPKTDTSEETPPDLLWADLALLRRECVLSGLELIVNGTDSLDPVISRAWDLQPVVSHIERLSQEMQEALVARIRTDMLPQAGPVYLLMDTEDTPDHLEDCYYLAMEELRASERIRLWKEVLPESAGISPEQIESLANTFVLTKGQIRDAAAQALRMTGPDKAVTEEPLYEVCYAKLGHPLRSHTQRVKSPFVWDDLKMNPVGKAVLRDLINCVRYRHIVMQEWNFEQKLPYGSGITALFAGPPGTGKTMAAQVIANELHMELYKIDLSQLIDKYVGETEKNIKRVFTEAGRSNSVLFFDEADAIFNKRLEAGNSNDRFANIETSLLLQCIEEFSGVTLLATNNMTSIDSAFLRRFRFYVQFWEPDEEIRYEIWKSVFPKEAPVDPEVDFRELAAIFNFTGAIIKNVALQAAYLAAESGGKIGLLEIMVAVRRELEKNRRMLSQDEMGKFGYLYPKVISWNSGQ